MSKCYVKKSTTKRDFREAVLTQWAIDNSPVIEVLAENLRFLAQDNLWTFMQMLVGLEDVTAIETFFTHAERQRMLPMFMPSASLPGEDGDC